MHIGDEMDKSSIENKKAILLDYYEGAYGPTIRIDVQSHMALTIIKDLFLQLAESKKTMIDLVQIDSVKAIGLNALLLKGVPDNQEPDKKLVLSSHTVTGNFFEWTMSLRNWKRAAGLIDGLLEYNRPGHQYLTEEAIDDALVELAFLE